MRQPGNERTDATTPKTYRRRWPIVAAGVLSVALLLVGVRAGPWSPVGSSASVDCTPSVEMAGGRATGGPATELALESGWHELPESPLLRRAGHSAVWTGREMIVWGGMTAFADADDGAAYDPIEGTWRTVPAAPVRARYGHSAIWTGSEMLVFGGSYRDLRDPVLRDGASYDPVTDGWRTIASMPAALPNPAIVAWADGCMLIWGGSRYGAAYSQGVAYDPVSDNWGALPDAPLSPRTGPVGVWTGDELIVWGGLDPEAAHRGTCPQRSYLDGAAYDPEHDTWRSIPPAPHVGDVCPGTRRAVWTGEEMLVFGFFKGARAQPVGLAFRPSTGQWRTLDSGPEGRYRSRHTAVWTGEALLVTGGQVLNEDTGFGSPTWVMHDGDDRYDPAADQWKTLPAAPISPRRNHPAVWTGSAMITWGGQRATFLKDGAIYVP